VDPLFISIFLCIYRHYATTQQIQDLLFTRWASLPSPEDSLTSLLWLWNALCLWKLECLQVHTYRVLGGLCRMSPGSACPVPVQGICFPRLWSVLPDSQLSLKNLRSFVLTYLRPLTNQFPIWMDLLQFMDISLT
jgi:hypothetical protein